MATIIRSITNASSTQALVIRVPGNDPNKVINLAASGTQDLLDLVSLETLQILQPTLAIMVANGSITSAATVDETTVQRADTPVKAATVSVTNAAVTAVADASDATTAAALANDLKAKYNAAVALINDLKTKINAMNA